MTRELKGDNKTKKSKSEIKTGLQTGGQNVEEDRKKKKKKFYQLNYKMMKVLNR